jgi:hypothetical protein
VNYTLAGDQANALGGPGVASGSRGGRGPTVLDALLMGAAGQNPFPGGGTTTSGGESGVTRGGGPPARRRRAGAQRPGLTPPGSVLPTIPGGGITPPTTVPGGLRGPVYNLPGTGAGAGGGGAAPGARYNLPGQGLPTAFNPGQLDPSKIGSTMPTVPGAPPAAPGGVVTSGLTRRR